MSISKKITWVVVVLLILLALGEWYFISNVSNATSQSNNTAAVTSSDKLINSFSFSGLSQEVDGAIDNTNYDINLLVPNGTDLTNLTPTISISDGATISPNSGVVEDFTNPVVYTVTAQDGSTQNYTVTVMISAASQSSNSTTTQSSSNPKSISSFSFADISPEVDGVIDNNDYAIDLTVPSGTDVTNLIPTVVVSNGATISPNSGVAEDFTNPVVYTVTAPDGSIQDYTVTVMTGVPSSQPSSPATFD